ncbi:MAG: phosphotransferase family protein [Myxococcota bacterium]|jgi:aminoglycoside phosphotransferase (APT) family kinase protein
MSVLDQTAKGLAAFLSQQWGKPVAIENMELASAGARRRNVLFDAVAGSERTGLVATIVPFAAMQLVPIEVEASNLQLAEAAGMPVPHVHAVSSDNSFVGGPFFVTSRIAGETIPRQVLRLVEKTPGLGIMLARQCGSALAKLHAADATRAHPLVVRPNGNPLEAALAVSQRSIGELLQPSPAFTLCFNWLKRNLPPAPRRITVVHGDFRNGNIIVSQEGLRASLDWEGCHIGDPMEDAGWVVQRMWRFRNDSLEVGGFGTRDDLRAGYQEAGGEWDEARFQWWKAQGTLRWGLGLAGQAKQHLDGSVPSIVLAASGRRVAELEYDTLMLLKRGFE